MDHQISWIQRRVFKAHISTHIFADLGTMLGDIFAVESAKPNFIHYILGSLEEAKSATPWNSTFLGWHLCS